MSTPNWQHNSGKDPKRKLKPQKLRDRKQALKALLRKLNFKKNHDSSGGNQCLSMPC